MNDFIADDDRECLERQGLADFDALWALQLQAVDEPNTERGGWSSVSRLELEGRAYYLKRQINHLTRSLRRPRGEPTFARELRNILRYQQLGIPALQAAFFGMREVDGERRAILLTRALDGWRDLDAWLKEWSNLPVERRQAILHACGMLARRLHEAGQMHGCFYPKHIFLKAVDDEFQACLIDLEKTRPLWFGTRDRVKDLEPLLRRAPDWSEVDVRQLLAAYLGNSASGAEVDHWYKRLGSRRRKKEKRG
ncbi:lipopolysaccharide kinase InaA family protein [Pseudomonas sp. QL9]|uniref:Putative lipopolysaccharide biosynthesis-like protein n=1 Tax=Pseudomonas knackmussii (strain DSM 6978 / CCUG 54928 / LMG 23759 / B13) TaxID=1301098 RepID=A0A024HNL3_PSEKB|nr:lipopolysaccharide kinase InaA family protein [Pseudomonas knackmussii]CDF86625.1 putative lipopolysaccharide biosynthesis-like protein [Pseudomonas knackmussii B13]